MTSTARIYECLADAINKSVPSIEANSVALRKAGHLAASKPGRGALPMTDERIAKLLLALMFDGPNDIPEKFLNYANLVPYPEGDVRIAALNRVLKPRLQSPMVEGAACFLDYIEAFVRLFREGRAAEVIHQPEREHEPWQYGGPEIKIEIVGPQPGAKIRFDPSAALAGDRKYARPISIEFADPAVPLHQRAMLDGDATALEAWGGYLIAIRERYSRGIGFTKFIGGRELHAIHEAYSDTS